MRGEASHEQPTVEIDPKEVVIAYIERERADWLPHHRRAERAGYMNAELNAEADSYMPRIDKLLDELSALSIRGTMNT